MLLFYRTFRQRLLWLSLRVDASRAARRRGFLSLNERPSVRSMRTGLGVEDVSRRNVYPLLFVRFSVQCSARLAHPPKVSMLNLSKMKRRYRLVSSAPGLWLSGTELSTTFPPRQRLQPTSVALGCTVDWALLSCWPPTFVYAPA